MYSLIVGPPTDSVGNILLIHFKRLEVSGNDIVARKRKDFSQRTDVSTSTRTHASDYRRDARARLPESSRAGKNRNTPE